MKDKKDTSNKLSFSLKLKMLPAFLDDVEYTLKELTGAARDEHLDTMRERMKFNEETGKAVGINTLKGIQTGLLSLCLYDDKDKLVEKDVIAGWPSTTVTGLYEAAQKLSGLDEDLKKREEKAKKA